MPTLHSLLRPVASAAVSVLILAASLLSMVPAAQAAPQVGPIDVSGEIDGAPFRIIVPPIWNGTLLVYGHPYRDKADHPGEVDNRTPDVAPDASAAATLLSLGYALSGSAYKDNGWSIEEGMEDLKNLTSHFRDTIAQPDRTLLWAFSTSTVIALKDMERGAGVFDGALCGCALGAGATATWDASADLTLAYDTVFGVPAAWGTFDDVRDDVDFETEVLPVLTGQVANPLNFPAFEFIRLVAGTPGRGIAPPPPPGFYPGWAFTDLFYAFEVRAELERRAGGPIVQNLDRDYTLAPFERAYLVSLGLPGAVIDGWLGAMNAQRVASAPSSSRNYVEHYADYSGKLQGPVVTLHTIVDPIVPVSHEQRYAETVAEAGRSSRLFQAYTAGNGHCAFTPAQVLTGLQALEIWVATGVAPTAASFPPALGFVPNFVPPPMNQP